MAKLWTPAEVAARLRIHPSAVRRLSKEYGIGTKVNDRMRVYTEEDITVLQSHSTGVPGRPRKLSESLDLAASEAEERAQLSIQEGDPKAAEFDLKVAAHMRRLAGHHRGSGNDPEQIA